MGTRRRVVHLILVKILPYLSAHAVLGIARGYLLIDAELDNLVVFIAGYRAGPVENGVHDPLVQLVAEIVLLFRGRRRPFFRSFPIRLPRLAVRPLSRGR